MLESKRVPLTPQQLNQSEVRPWLRAVAAVFLALLSAMFAFFSVSLFSATTIAITACSSKQRATSQLLCELGNLILTQIPAQHRGVYEGVLHLLTAIALMVAAFLLLRPSRN